MRALAKSMLKTKEKVDLIIQWCNPPCKCWPGLSAPKNLPVLNVNIIVGSPMGKEKHFRRQRFHILGHITIRVSLVVVAHVGLSHVPLGVGRI